MIEIWTPDRFRHLAVLWGAAFRTSTIADVLGSTPEDICNAAQLLELSPRLGQGPHSMNINLAWWLVALPDEPDEPDFERH